MDKKQHTRNEIKKETRDRLQERYNNICKDYYELKGKYDRLVHFAVEVAFSDFNQDVEILLRYLNKIGIVETDGNLWINPYHWDPNLVEEKEIDRSDEDYYKFIDEHIEGEIKNEWK